MKRKGYSNNKKLRPKKNLTSKWELEPQVSLSEYEASQFGHFLELDHRRQPQQQIRSSLHLKRHGASHPIPPVSNPQSAHPLRQ